MFVTCKHLGKFGSLGNQLFQIASTIGIAKSNNMEAQFPSWFCVYTKKDMQQFFVNHIPKLDVDQILQNHQETSFSYQPVILNQSTNLSGYYQSELYFKHCEDLIRWYFQPTTQVLKKLNEKYGDVSDYCSIHVRRGDYVNNPVHEVCDLNYYKSAIKLMEIKTDKFMVFSDDIKWCKEFFDEKYLFVEGNQDVEDLILMSQCSHNIISNSTFSWWGSWLNNRPNKCIIAPTRWFKTNNMDTSTIHTKEMIQL